MKAFVSRSRSPSAVTPYGSGSTRYTHRTRFQR
jgi:hypothetical protein